MFRFRFQALLAIRRRDELGARGLLARALADVREANAARTCLDDEVKRARGDLREVLRPTARDAATPGHPVALMALLSHLAELDARLVRARERLDEAERARREAALRLELVARPRRALERLEANERLRYERARERAEAAEIGESNARCATAGPSHEGMLRG